MQVCEYMDLADNKLPHNEAIVYHANRHWALLLGPILIIFIGGLAIKPQGYHGMALVGFGLLWGIFSYISLTRSEMVLTQNKVLMNIGFPLRRSYDIALNEITFVDFYQPSLGSMLNFGKIIILYANKKKCVIRFVSSPAEFVKEIQQQIVAFRQSSTKK